MFQTAPQTFGAKNWGKNPSAPLKMLKLQGQNYIIPPMPPMAQEVPYDLVWKSIGQYLQVFTDQIRQQDLPTTGIDKYLCV